MPAPEDNQAVVHQYVAAFNRGDVEAVGLCFGPDALVFGMPGGGEAANVRAFWEQLVRCFQINLHIESLLAIGDTVAARYVERGVFTAAFRDQPPTGRAYEVVAMEWFEFRDGLIHRRWSARDSASIFRQMGIVPV